MTEDGCSYKGEFDNNVLCGRGIFKWKDGKYFDGFWKADKMHGKGFFKWPDGREYDGEYKYSKKEGYGYLVGLMVNNTKVTGEKVYRMDRVLSQTEMVVRNWLLGQWSQS